ncbi:hypothetical protein PybrP1_008968 [[Pythium] brassicae (nom. inval.)]|nr:hypothetical protein PybrP1_008968 [[Pythium] brassicae (nom. inval.)]
MADGAAGRKLSARSLELLQNHSLFRFQIQDASVRERVAELRDMVVGASGEPDHAELLADLVHDIEDEIADSDTRELYLLASLGHFSQQVTMLLEVDAEDALDPAGLPTFADIFARETAKPAGAASAKQTAPRITPTAAASVATAKSPSAAAGTKKKNAPVALDVAAPPVHVFVSAASRGATTQATSKATPKAKAMKPTKRTQPALSAPAGGVVDNADAVEGGEDEDEDDVACGVCFEADSLENDPIVICELCSTAVHQSCYRIPFVPDGDWHCHPCTRFLKEQDVEQNVTPTRELACVACLAKGGALMPTLEGAWMHVMCSMFLPEIAVNQVGVKGDVCCGVHVEQERLKARRKLRCCFCKKTYVFAVLRGDKGACAQCVVGKCVVAYHVPCALKHGIKFEFIEAQRHFGSGCLAHQDKFLKMDGLSADEDEETAAVDVVAPTASPSHTVRPTPTAKRHQARAKADKKSKEKKKPGVDSWDDKGSEKDEHVLISSGSESDEDFRPRDDAARALTGKDATPGPKATTSSKKRQLKSELADDASARHSKKGRQSVMIPFVKPSAIATQAGGAIAAATRHTVDDHSAAQAITQTRVFVPAFYPPGLQSGDSDSEYEYVMVVVQSQLTGVGMANAPTSSGAKLCLSEGKTSNRTILEALKRGVIQEHDEIVAVNQTVLRNVSVDDVRDSVLPKLKYPAQCWFRTQRRGLSQATGSAAVVKESKSTGENDGLSVDWPWCFLRSDGKIAMNLFWRSLDGAFFLSKINRRELLALQNRLEAMVGVRFSPDHAEYSDVLDLLAMPKREFVPPYLLEFRKTRQQKQKFLSSDIFLGVSAESLKADDDVDDQPPLAVGTVVTVAKRTWAGINKLGGAGRVRRVHEVALEGGRKRFKYDIAYVLGGGEKKVERKYISVVDLSKDTAEPGDGAEATQSTASHATSTTDGNTEGSTKMRLRFQVERSDDETLLAALTALARKQPKPSRRIFEFQVSTENGNVHLVRKAADRGDAAPKDLLLHKHFAVKRSDEDAIVNASFRPSLQAAEERVGDSVDDLDDDNESDDEEDEIKTQLEALQLEFGAVLSRTQAMFCEITSKIEHEYATKAYRTQRLEEIRRRHQEQMYRDIVAARQQFDDSDDENESDGGDKDEDGGRRPSSQARELESSDDEKEDETFGGLFVNKIKQEGDEVCVLCELSGGDFAATSCGQVVHPQCAMYTPETFFKDGVCHGIEQIPSDRRSLPCAICQGRKGLSKIQCANKRCVVAYHIACAFVNGLLIRAPHYRAWCPKHLKGSGMATEVELPEHMKKASGAVESQVDESSQQQQLQRKRATKGKKGRRQTPRAGKAVYPGAMSSSKSKKRRRKSTATRDELGNRDDDRADRGDDNEPRCARRLDINEDSEGDSGTSAPRGKAAAGTPTTVPDRVFQVNDVVMILPREWIGSNKPGGVARIRAVHTSVDASTGETERFYDITYVLSSSKDKRVEAEYVRAYDSAAQESAASTPSGRKKGRLL